MYPLVQKTAMKNLLFLSFLSISFILLFATCTRDKLPEVVPGECIEGVSYTYESSAREIIVRTCTQGSGCHNAAGRGDYGNFSILEPHLHDDPNGFKDWVLTTEGMPPNYQPDELQLTEEEQNELKCWIEAGYPQN